MKHESGRLFGTAGIRGRYLSKITPELAFQVGAAVATYLNASKIVVGGDGRLTTPLLKLAASAGLMSAGSDVIDVGLVPLPVLAWSVRRYDCDGGIYVTASHNPPTDNGLKVFDRKGMEFTQSMERELEHIIAESTWKRADWDSVGTHLNQASPLPDYINELIEFLKPVKVSLTPKVLIDTANGAPSLATPQVLKSLGSKVVTLNANIDGRFPGRAPEPRPDVLEPYLPIARDLGAHVFFAHDGDGDRLAVLDPVKGFIKQDRVIALIAKYRLSIKKGTVVVSIDVGNTVRDVVNEAGGNLAVVRLGKIHEGLLQHSDALIAAEPWKLIDPSWGVWIDGIYQAALITKLMMEEGKSIGELMRQIPDYPQARYSLKMDERFRDEVYEHLVGKLHDLMRPGAKVTELDGVRIDFPDKSWILIRKSGTEARKIRIYSESADVGRLKELVEELIKHARDYLLLKGSSDIEVEGKIIP